MVASFRASTELLRKPNDVGFAEDNCFVAIVPQLAGCSAVGSSMEEAVPEVQDAITAWIGAAKKAGNPVPTPLILARAGRRSHNQGDGHEGHQRSGCWPCHPA